VDLTEVVVVVKDIVEPVGIAEPVQEVVRAGEVEAEAEAKVEAEPAEAVAVGGVSILLKNIPYHGILLNHVAKA